MLSALNPTVCWVLRVSCDGIEKARERGNVPGVTVRRKSKELAEEMEKEVPVHLGEKEALVPSR